MSPATKSIVRSLIGITVVAGATYLFDPDNGRQRRAVVRERCASATSRLTQKTRVTRDGLANRFRDVSARTRKFFGRAEEPDASVEAHLPERPSEAVPVDDGASLRQRFALVRDRLRQERWSPSTRMVTGAAGGGLMAWGARSRGAASGVAAILGAAIVLRSATNIPLKGLVKRNKQAMRLRTSIELKAPVQRVFEVLATYENFPVFMRSVRHVIRHDDGTAHWTVTGPSGVSAEWDSQTTLYRPNEILAWRSRPNSILQHAGMLRFERIDEEHTRLHVDLSYSTGNSRSRVVKDLFGADPKKELIEDLAHLREFLESGATQRSDAEKRGGAGPGDGTPGHRAWA